MKIDHIAEINHDDVFVHGHSEKEHDPNDFNPLQVARNNGLVIYSENDQMKHPQFIFYGTIFCKEGLKPDPEKIQEITEMHPLFRHVKLYAAIYTTLVTLYSTSGELLERNQAFYWDDNINAVLSLYLL